MSHYPYNAHAFGNQRTTQEQNRFSSREVDQDSQRPPYLMESSSRLGFCRDSPRISDSLGMLPSVLPQSMSYRPEQSRSTFDQDMEGNIGVRVSRVREEVNVQTRRQDVHITTTHRDVIPSPAMGRSYPVASRHLDRHPDVESSSSSLDWLEDIKRSTGDYSSTRVSSSDSSNTAGRSDERKLCSEPGSDIPLPWPHDYFIPDEQPSPPKINQSRYSSEFASKILLKFGLDKEDLEQFVNYPEDQITPESLPFILRHIRLQKDKRTTRAVESKTFEESNVYQPAAGIDYGHSGKYAEGLVDETVKKTTYTRLHSGTSMLTDTSGRNSWNQLLAEKVEAVKSYRTSQISTVTIPNFSSSSTFPPLPPPSHDSISRCHTQPVQPSPAIPVSISWTKKDTAGSVLSSEAFKPTSDLVSPGGQPSQHGFVTVDSNCGKVIKHPDKTQAKGTTVGQQLKGQQTENPVKPQMGQTIRRPGLSDMKPVPLSSHAASVANTSGVVQRPGLHAGTQDISQAPKQPIPSFRNTVPVPPSIDVPVSQPGVKRFLTSVWSDVPVAVPKRFPHSCLLCKTDFFNLKDWLIHQRSNVHRENCSLSQETPTTSNDQSACKSVPQISREGHNRDKNEDAPLSRSANPPYHHGDGSSKSHSSRSPQNSKYNRRSRSCSYSPRYSSSYHYRSRSSSQERPFRESRSRSQKRRSRESRSRSQNRRSRESRSGSQKRRSWESRSRSQKRRSRESRSRSQKRRSRESRSRSQKRRSRESRSRSQKRRSRESRSRSQKRRSRESRSRSQKRRSCESRSRSQKRRSRESRSRSQRRRLRESRSRSQRRRLRESRSRSQRRRLRESRSRSQKRRAGESRSRSRERGSRSSRSRSHERCSSRRSQERKSQQSHSRSCKKYSRSRSKESRTSQRRSRERRLSQNKSSNEQKKLSSVKRLAQKLLHTSAAHSLSHKSDLDDVVKTLAPVLLAELANMKPSSSSDSSSAPAKKKETAARSSKRKSENVKVSCSLDDPKSGQMDDDKRQTGSHKSTSSREKSRQVSDGVSGDAQSDPKRGNEMEIEASPQVPEDQITKVDKDSNLVKDGEVTVKTLSEENTEGNKSDSKSAAEENKCEDTIKEQPLQDSVTEDQITEADKDGNLVKDGDVTGKTLSEENTEGNKSDSKSAAEENKCEDTIKEQPLQDSVTEDQITEADKDGNLVKDGDVTGKTLSEENTEGNKSDSKSAAEENKCEDTIKEQPLQESKDLTYNQEVPNEDGQQNRVCGTLDSVESQSHETQVVQLAKEDIPPREDDAGQVSDSVGRQPTAHSGEDSVTEEAQSDPKGDNEMEIEASSQVPEDQITKVDKDDNLVKDGEVTLKTLSEENAEVDKSDNNSTSEENKCEDTIKEQPLQESKDISYNQEVPNEDGQQNRVCETLDSVESQIHETQVVQMAKEDLLPREEGDAGQVSDSVECQPTSHSVEDSVTGDAQSDPTGDNEMEIEASSQVPEDQITKADKDGNLVKDGDVTLKTLSEENTEVDKSDNNSTSEENKCEDTIKEQPLQESKDISYNQEVPNEDGQQNRVCETLDSVESQIHETQVVQTAEEDIPPREEGDAGQVIDSVGRQPTTAEIVAGKKRKGPKKGGATLRSEDAPEKRSGATTRLASRSEGKSSTKQENVIKKYETRQKDATAGRSTADTEIVKVEEQTVSHFGEDEPVPDAVSVDMPGRRRSARRNKEDKMTLSLTEASNKTNEDKEGMCEIPTRKTRSGRGRTERTPKREASAEDINIVQEEDAPTTTIHTVSDSEERKEEATAKEEDKVTQQQTATNGDIIRTQIPNEEETSQISHSLEDEAIKDDSPVPRRKKGRPKKTVQAGKIERTKCKSGSDAPEEAPGGATNPFLESVEPQTPTEEPENSDDPTKISESVTGSPKNNEEEAEPVSRIDSSVGKENHKELAVTGDASEDVTKETLCPLLDCSDGKQGDEDSFTADRVGPKESTPEKTDKNESTGTSQMNAVTPDGVTKQKSPDGNGKMAQETEVVASRDEVEVVQPGGEGGGAEGGAEEAAPANGEWSEPTDRKSLALVIEEERPQQTTLEPRPLDQMDKMVASLNPEISDEAATTSENEAGKTSGSAKRAHEDDDDMDESENCEAAQEEEEEEEEVTIGATGKTKKRTRLASVKKSAKREKVSRQDERDVEEAEPRGSDGPPPTSTGAASSLDKDPLMLNATQQEVQKTDAKATGGSQADAEASLSLDGNASEALSDTQKTEEALEEGRRAHLDASSTGEELELEASKNQKLDGEEEDGQTRTVNEEECLNSVTAEEVGVVEEEEPVRARGRAKRSSRLTPVRKSTRKKKEGEKQAEKEPDVTEMPPSSSLDASSSSKNHRSVLVGDVREPEAEVEDGIQADASCPEQEPENQKRQEEEEEEGGADAAVKAVCQQEEFEPEAKRPRSRSPCVSAEFKLPPFKPSNPLGEEFVVPKLGLFCNVCSVFCMNESAAKQSHCSSQTHYDNLQKHYQNLQQAVPKP